MPRRRPAPVRLLALHGTVADPTVWDEVGRRCGSLDYLAPDLRELSRAVEGRVASLVRAVAAMAPSDPLVVAGCGIGANLAVEVASLLGERVRGVVAVNPCPLNPDPTFRERVLALAELFREMAPAETRRFVPVLVHPGAAGYRRLVPVVERMLEGSCGEAGVELIRLCADYPDTRTALARIAAPVHVMFGAETVNPFHGADCELEWERAVGAEAFERLPLTGSFAPLEVPDLVAAVVERFASSHFR